MPDEQKKDESKPVEPEAGDDNKLVDEGWKAQARKEKEDLEQKLQDEADKARARQLPPAEFLPFVSGIAAQALMQLGEIENPIYGKKEVDLEAARYSIDIIGVLEEKTKGNLTKEEEGYLAAAVHDLRMRYIEASKAAASGGDAAPVKEGD